MLNYFENKKIESQERKRPVLFSMQCIQVLRDAVHGLGWSSKESPEFGPFEDYIRAADAIGDAIFNSVHGPGEFYESDKIFRDSGVERSHESHFAERLLALELGENNQLRDSLAKNPTYTEGLHLIGRLLDHVMQSVHKERMQLASRETQRA